MGAVEAEQPIEDQAGPLERLVSRYDAGVFDVGRPLVRLRIEIGESVTHDVVITDGQARLESPPQRPRWDAERRRGDLESTRR